MNQVVRHKDFLAGLKIIFVAIFSQMAAQVTQWSEH